jgi:hypothetical protein
MCTKTKLKPSEIFIIKQRPSTSEMSLRQALSEIYTLRLPENEQIPESWQTGEFGFNEAKRGAHTTNLSPATAKQERLARSFVRACAGNGLTLKQMIELLERTHSTK